ncbi:MAG: SPOR domain-containing protein [Gammaproteobacteria bacterium]
MSRDYKNAANHRRNRAGAGWVWFISGIGAGALAALVAYLHFSKHPAPPPLAPTLPAASAAPTPAPAPEEPEPEAEESQPPKPRFDFYTILPEMEVKVPDWASANPSAPPPPVLEPGSYVLQVASFQRFEDADKVKAKLALHGIVADIQRVVINGNETWFRVRVGPFKELERVDAMRSKLQQAGMDFMLLRIKEG